ncbi:TIGR03617 family F420-dependent LLM class oxidoreductase [Candidatus Poriferisocius sp.]|uniref:TIGR03617 family F420-dependent LLM class oxidoreductase n=1 Tax=Candidatus Poriferisocius sp. TaxID=3101276 RepID=UPI003B01399E
MKLDGGLVTRAARKGSVGPLGDAADNARNLEAAGYDGIWSAELDHDPFLPLVLAAEHTTRIQIGTSIAVSFARNPMILANLGWDLQAYSSGRFILGLGSQIKPHITKRFSMPWSHPAARMKEMIDAVKAIWDCWETGEKLSFRGEFYQHTLMTPMFSPGANPFGPPPIHLAAVGDLMTEAAGESADGWISHGFTTPSYVREVSLPALERGAARAGRDPMDIEVSMPVFIVTGETEEEMASAAQAARQQLAFYGSTPAYRPVLEHHGWGDAQDELNRMSKQGQWVEMADVIDDTMLGTFGVVAEPQNLASGVAASYGGLIDRMSFGQGLRADGPWGEVREALRAIPGRSHH